LLRKPRKRKNKTHVACMKKRSREWKGLLLLSIFDDGY